MRYGLSVFLALSPTLFAQNPELNSPLGREFRSLPDEKGAVAAAEKALAEHPNVALTIDTDDPAARQLLIRGPADTEIVDGIPPEYLAAAAKSMSAAELPPFEAQVRAMYKQMARIAVRPDWARFYDFGAGRLPAFLQQLAAQVQG